MKENKIASVVALTILTLGLTPMLSSASIPIEIISTPNNDSTPSFSVESAFKSPPTEDKPVISNIKEINITKKETPIQTNNSDEVNESDDGISISNVDENGNQTLFVQRTQFDDINWQISVQTQETDYDKLKDFFNKGFSVDRQVFNDGNNMLILSAMQQREELLKFAVSNGANLKYFNKQGQNAYHWASNGYNPEILSYLLDKNKTLEVINKSDNNGKTPLHFASANGNLKIVELLLKNNANISAKDKDERTPLFYALIYKKYDIANLLLKSGADTTLSDKNGISIEYLILNSSINMFEMSYKILPKTIQDKIITSLKDAPHVAYKLANPSVTYEKIKEMEKNGISVDEDIIS